MVDTGCYGLLAEFASPEALLQAARKTRLQGYRALDAFTPFPVEGLAEILEFKDRRVLRLGLIGGCLGFAVALAMQCLTNFAYPINVGGRPLYPLSAFAVVAFELIVLFAALVPAVGMLALNGLPRLHHPLFSAPRFHLASRDRFFLCIEARDPKFSESGTAEFLESLEPAAIERVPA